MFPMRPSRALKFSAARAVPFVMSSILTSPRGVAVDTASAPAEKKGDGAVQEVICTGKEIRRKTLATRAGLKGL